VKERNALSEAKRMSIPVIAMVDTNCNPDEIDHPIPSNDDAIRAIKLITSKMAEAVLEAKMSLTAGPIEKTEGEAEGEPAKAAEPAEPLIFTPDEK